MKGLLFLAGAAQLLGPTPSFGATTPAPRPSPTPTARAASRAPAPNTRAAVPARPVQQPPAPLSPAAAAAAADNRPITQGQFREFLKLYRQNVDRTASLESKVGQIQTTQAAQAAAPPPTPKKGEEAIDLSAPSKPSAPASAEASSSILTSGFGIPSFKVYFDFNIVYKPGVENLSFDNYHSFLFFDIIPLPNLQFTFDVSPSPRFYELDYSPWKWLTIRAGKIWIPWDDTSPHEIYGGRVNVSRLTDTNPTYLPDLWSDLGIGFKFTPVDNKYFQLTLDLYGTNGIGSGGNDPLNPGNEYPNFGTAAVSAIDNNMDKMIGTRMHMWIINKIGLGASYAYDRWNNDTNLSAPTAPLAMHMFAVDGQFRIAGFEARGGWSEMLVALPGDAMTRGGWYGELSQKFGKTQNWKVMLRGGQVQLDNRVLAQ
ncbi:MAG: hypothetical protein ACXWP5_10315, partial [Bdellovibrionota bacterium]